MNLLSQFLWRQRTRFERTVRLGGHRITLPAGHLLDWRRLRHRRYDQPIAEIAELLRRKYGAPTMIDVGANIGDTAALMLRSPEIAVLCIEGNEAFLPLLRENLGNLSKTSEIEPSYVGAENDVLPGRMRLYEGTSTLVESSERVHTRNIMNILEDHPKFGDSRLLKIDTDGFDAKIVMSASDFLSDTKPVVIVEYSPYGIGEEERECNNMIQSLKHSGYVFFHVFDNFGNHMLRLPAEHTEHLYALNAYVRSTRKDLRPSLFYFDICALTSRDEDISEQLMRTYLECA